MRLFKRPLGKKAKAAINALADGIECGAKLHPEGIGALATHPYGDETQLQTCALGAGNDRRLAVDAGEQLKEAGRPENLPLIFEY
jgi:hypothetical protein